jgi:hypothetical protein
MRRVLASLLVALFSFSLIAPAVFASDPDSKLPACCRRAGKHHCTIATRGQSPAGPAAQTARCDLFPCSGAVPANQVAGLPGISRVVVTGLFSHPATLSRTATQSRISYSQAGQKRGPPALAS